MNTKESTLNDYQAFLATKTRKVPDAGISIDTDEALAARQGAA